MTKKKKTKPNYHENRVSENHFAEISSIAQNISRMKEGRHVCCYDSEVVIPKNSM